MDIDDTQDTDDTEREEDPMLTLLTPETGLETPREALAPGERHCPRCDRAMRPRDLEEADTAVLALLDPHAARYLDAADADEEGLVGLCFVCSGQIERIAALLEVERRRLLRRFPAPSGQVPLAPDQRLSRPFEELRDTLLATIFGQATALQRAGQAAYLTIDEAGDWDVHAAGARSSARGRSLTVLIPDPVTPDREGELAARFYQALYGLVDAGDGGPRLREPDDAGDGEDGDGLAVRDELDRLDPELNIAEVDALLIAEGERHDMTTSRCEGM